eukprot:CAMPEP_0198467592 /NCGR_PEP_ID=MMETSP1456-20131121/4975_1 /TAXON_ID=1461544 ORGANISM="Unidentified sp., Strain RCC1871" /NCGR_SAMPLE_ID=MMETSP1456 /ASSEMBLY_ACC=CAM_ASM_001119 /LENGTH=223 /DNA_ID=CAMNT_0044193639 /DNA_START=187 /DNA_END=853 /DNA_ORIENTATION=+
MIPSLLSVEAAPPALMSASPPRADLASSLRTLRSSWACRSSTFFLRFFPPLASFLALAFPVDPFFFFLPLSPHSSDDDDDEEEDEDEDDDEEEEEPPLILAPPRTLVTDLRSSELQLVVDSSLTSAVQEARATALAAPPPLGVRVVLCGLPTPRRRLGWRALEGAHVVRRRDSLAHRLLPRRAPLRFGRDPVPAMSSQHRVPCPREPHARLVVVARAPPWWCS